MAVPVKVFVDMAVKAIRDEGLRGSVPALSSLALEAPSRSKSLAPSRERSPNHMHSHASSSPSPSVSGTGIVVRRSPLMSKNSELESLSTLMTRCAAVTLSGMVYSA